MCPHHIVNHSTSPPSTIAYSEKTTTIAAVPSVVTVPAWDGKDAVVEAEIPLGDLFDEL